MLTTVDRERLSVLFTEYDGPLQAWLRRRGISADVAQDAAAETWAILARVVPGRLDPARDSALAYLRVVAWHEALRTLDDSDAGGQLADRHADVHRQAEDRLELGEILDAVAHLSRGQQTALIGRMIGLSYDEIGTTAGHPSTSSVNTWANRHVTEGRKRLRNRLEG